MRRHWLLGILALATVAGAGYVDWASAEDAHPGGEEWKAPARAAKKKNTVPADDKSSAAGKVMYQQECLACHGETGRGDGPSAHDLEKTPGDLSKPVMWEQSDGALFWKITEGRKPMPTYAERFTDEQRWSIVNYVRTLAPKPQGK